MQNPLAGMGPGFGGSSVAGPPNLGHQLPVGATTTGNTAGAMIAARAALKPSQIETAISIPRPDPASMWMAHQAAAVRSSQDKNTAVLIAVAVLTAICVIALGTLIYLKSRAPQPAPAPASSSLLLDTADHASIV